MDLVLRLVLRLALVAALLSPLAASAADLLDRAAFTRRYAEALRRALPEAKVDVEGELQLRFKSADGDQHTSLGNAYAEYQADPEELDAVIDRYVGSSVEHLRSKHEKVARDRIVPVLKTRATIEGFMAQVRELQKKDPTAKMPDPLWEPVNDELIVMYAEDTPRNMRYLGAAEIREAGVGRTELRALALKNLLALLPEVRVEEVKGGIYMVVADRNYEATLILSDEVVARFPALEGDLVFAVPARDLLVFTGSRNEAGVEVIRQLADKFAREAGHALTPTLFVRRSGGKIEPL